MSFFSILNAARYLQQSIVYQSHNSFATLDLLNVASTRSINNVGNIMKREICIVLKLKHYTSSNSAGTVYLIVFNY